MAFADIGAAFAGGIASSLGGSLFGGGGGGLTGHDLVVAQQREADRARKWELHVRPKDLYLRHMQGMRRAGLNPVLAMNSAKQIGAAASGTPTVAPSTGDTRSSRMAANAQMRMATVHTARVAAETNLLNKQAEKAAEEAKTEGTKRTVNLTQADLNDAMTSVQGVLQHKMSKETEKIIQETRTEMEREGEVLASKQVLEQRVKNLREELKLTGKQVEKLFHEMPGIMLEGNIDRSEYGVIVRHLNRALPTVNTALGVAGTAAMYKKLDKIFVNPKTTFVGSKKTGEIYNP